MSVTTYDHAPHDGAGGPRMNTVEALRRLALGRDGEAWSAVLHNHGVDILRLALRITGDSSLCEDACQETLLQIRAHAGSFTPPPRPKEAEAAARGWVMCIAYRTTLGMLRVRQRRTENEEQAGLAQRAKLPAESDPLLTLEQLSVVRREISGLPELLRSAVCLHFYGNMTYPELSAALECSEKAARKRVERGVQRLRLRLASCGLAIGAGALVAALVGPSQASAAASALNLSNALSVSRLAEWQALLHHPAAPLLAGVAKAGGIAIMGKYVVGVAALLAFALSGVQAIRIHSLSRELAEMRDKTAAAEGNQDRIAALEKQLTENTGETAALKSSLSSRSEEMAQLSKKIDQKSPYGFQSFDLPTGKAQDFFVHAMPNGAPGVALQDGEMRVFKYTAPPNVTAPAPKTTTAEVKEVLGQIPIVGELFQETLKPPAAEELDPKATTELLRKMHPNLPQPGNDMVMTVLPDGTIQYKSLDGRVMQQYRDTRLVQELAKTPGKTPPATGASGAPAVSVPTAPRIVKRVQITPPAMPTPPPMEVTPQYKAVKRPKEGTPENF